MELSELFYTFLHSEIPIWPCCLNQLQKWSVLKIWVATPTQSSARLPLFGHPWRPAFLKKVWCRTQWQQTIPSSQIIAEPWYQELMKTRHWTIEKLWHRTHTPCETLSNICAQASFQKQQVWMSWCPDVWCLEATTKAFKAAGSADISHLKTHRNGCEMRAISETQDAVKYVKINMQPGIPFGHCQRIPFGFNRDWQAQQFLNPDPLLEKEWKRSEMLNSEHCLDR